MNPTSNDKSEMDRLIGQVGVSGSGFREALRRLEESDRPRFRRWWSYYRNPMTGALPGDGGGDRPYRQAQEWGLPSRITGFVSGNAEASAEPFGGVQRKEVVVENDIGWRIDAMVDHLFGREVFVESTHPDEARRSVLSAVARAVLQGNGGTSFLQQAGLLGMVYGFVDVVVKLDAAGAEALWKEVGGDLWGRLIVAPAGETAAPGGREREAGDNGAEADPSASSVRGETESGTGGAKTPDGRLIERLARLIHLELVHPSHALPLPVGVEQPEAYARVWETTRVAEEAAPQPRRWWQRATAPVADTTTRVRHIELLTAGRFLRTEGGVTVQQGAHSLGELPVVHIQNLAVPFEYAGRSDVEPLIPLQDELNTRLSDRAHRITMQSFKMFLGKGVDNFLSMPVGPGRMWATDNDDAEIKEFGGDERCPSEELHIGDVREAMDKASGVPPVAAGVIRDRVGQLSSAAALRVTLQSLLAKTDRKRATYGRGIAEICRLALGWLSAAGLLPTESSERQVSLVWPSPLPENTLERLREAEIKARLGVPMEQVRREIGY